MASGTGRKAQGGITAIYVFFLAPYALHLACRPAGRLEPLVFQQCFGYRIGK